jgi:hypothetical protein
VGEVAQGGQSTTGWRGFYDAMRYDAARGGGRECRSVYDLDREELYCTVVIVTQYCNYHNWKRAPSNGTGPINSQGEGRAKTNTTMSMGDGNGVI